MASFLELVQQLQREVGVSGTAVSTVSGQTGIRNKLVQWIADADVFIQSKHWDWKFLWSQYSKATVAGTANPTGPSDLNVWDRDSFYLNYSASTHKKLTTLDYQDWLHSYRQGTKTNQKPSYVIIKPDNSLVLEPPPDDAYTLTGDYWATPSKMTGNTDTSAIPAAFHRIIVIQAKLWYAEEQEIPTVYQAADREMNGNPGNREEGLLDRLESLQLPEQERRMMGSAEEINVIPE